MENKEYKAIATGLYGGSNMFSKTKTPYELEVVSCCNSENCPLFKQKKCIMAERMSRMNWWAQDAKCPYSQINTRKGKSSRSKDYYVLKHEYYDDQFYKDIKDLGITPAQSMMYFEIGDYSYIRLTELGCKITMSTTEPNKRRIITNHWSDILLKDETYLLSGDGFIRKSNFTAEFFKQLFEKAEWNGRSKAVEALKADIYKARPDLAEKLGIEAPNYVGRKARLNTLTPPFEFEKEKIKYQFTEDKMITSTDPKVIDDMLLSKTWTKYIGELVEVKATFKPKDDVYIEVADNSWVNDNTVFK